MEKIKVSYDVRFLQKEKKSGFLKSVVCLSEDKYEDAKGIATDGSYHIGCSRLGGLSFPETEELREGLSGVVLCTTEKIRDVTIKVSTVETYIHGEMVGGYKF